MTYALIDLRRQYKALAGEIQTALDRALAAAAFINGPEVREFEAALADYAGVAEAVGCANGTDALALTLMAWGVGPGDAVFCPAFTFVATAEAAALRGARPVFVDIDPATYNLDPEDLRAKLQAVRAEGRLRPKAVIPVDLFGLPADYEVLEPFCAAEGLLLLEDAAQGFGGRLGRRRAGSFGQAGATSFFPAKPLGGYGDGGAVLTDDRGLAAELRSRRAHGAGGHKYEHARLGVNSRLDTLQAAVLLVKLKAFPRELEERQRVAAGYTRLLRNRLVAPAVPAGFYSSWAQYTVRVPAGRREMIADRLQAQGVATAVYYPRPLHLQPAFAAWGGRSGDLPAAEKAAAEVLSLPMHPYLSDAEVAEIADLVLAAAD